MATAIQKKRHNYYIKKRGKVLKRMQRYYKTHRSARKAYQKRYYRKTKGKGPMYLRGKGKGKRPLFARVTAHNRRNGKFAKGVKGTQKGRKPAATGRAFKPLHTATKRRRKAA